MPTTAGDAKGLLLESIFDDNQVIFMEHRWLHNLEGDVPEGDYRVPLGTAKILKEGKYITIVSLSYMTIEALHAIDHFAQNNISCELIDLRTIKPIDWQMIYSSVNKTGRLLALDTAAETGSVAGEIIARVSMECFHNLKAPPQRLALPDFPTPTSFSLTKNFYKRAEDIIDKVAFILDLDLKGNDLINRGNVPHDVPGDLFKGPF